MAFVGFALGSVIGAFFGLFGLFILDLSVWKSLALYMSSGLFVGMGVVCIGAIRGRCGAGRDRRDPRTPGTFR